MIISASRRTDIPSFYGKWFINRLKEGYVLIQNPYNTKRYSKALLTRDNVDCIVFWTKNPIPFFKYLNEVDRMGYPYYFQFTLTPYGKDIEKNLPSKKILIDTFISLSKHIGSHRIVWRYDPIIIDDKFNISYHINAFEKMATLLKNYTNRCIISFIDSYKNISTRLGYEPKYQITYENINLIAKAFSTIAKENNIILSTCAESVDLSEFNIYHASCIDKHMIEDILGCKINAIKDKNQRKDCGCIESIDIGTYNCCANGCNYCYALKNQESSYNNIKKHDPKSPVLIGQPNPNAIITKRKSTSVCVNQITIFDM